jgi:asparagine synthase (glutamine-hydrolysing)
MCGIAGFWEPNHPSPSINEDLSAMTCVLHHRGPDGQGAHIDSPRGLAMGHTRLSIIDLKTGDQPLYAHDRSLILTTNGEFYDYKRHRAELASEGIGFTTKSDAEIAIPYYQKYDLDFVEKLRGEFAVALFDERKERLILVRDRFGIKPLYYRLTDDAVYYGSEVKSVLRNPRVPRDLCPKAAIHQMMQVMVPGTTAFKSVDALLPGHILVIQREGNRLTSRDIQYWDLEFPDENDHDYDADPKHYIDRVRDLLIDAVATRLEADVPVGCYLSGGIDSCAMLGLATPLQQSPVKAFTISFDHDDYDEATIAREMAERTNADQELLKLTAADLYGPYFERVTWHTERTFYNTLSVAKWHMSRRVNECGFKVVVTGEGSDELLGGYPFFKRDMFLHGSHAGDWKSKQGGADGVFQGAIMAETQQSHPAWEDLCGFTPSWIQPWMLTLETCRPLFAPELQDSLADHDPVAAVAEAIDPAKIRNRHALDKAQYTWSKTMLEGQILTWGGDRVDMANSMESRPAFLDHHLAEFAVTIPPNLRIKDGVEKWVLREAMKGILPEVLYKREKFAFMAPPSHTDPAKRNAVQSLVDKWLTPDHIGHTGLFDQSKVEAMLNQWNAGADPTTAKRLDIIINHLLQIHILSDIFAGPYANTHASTGPMVGTSTWLKTADSEARGD